MCTSIAVLSLAAAAGAKSSGHAKTNRLAAEASPYLQLHAGNPVDWYPWGDEAFERARLEDKPIFLSVGYSTCFWCHVMEREVFSNAKIAAQMNESFVSVKVDREERPDIDDIYMTATHLLTGSGGWPNSVFLTPDGEPFFAGTYFPPEDSGRRRGFPSVLRQLNDAWQNRRTEVLRLAAQTRERIESQSAALPPATVSFEPASVLKRAVDQIEASYEPLHGGFSKRTKFPSPPKLELLLEAHRAEAHPRAHEMLTKTLDEMALGGIYDHLAGGFHRYSVEPTWSIPHYEKMLYDNGQLLGVYARAYEVTGKPLYRHVTLEIAGYLEREMKHPEGGFYSAQDAEVDGHEGLSYLWTRQQLVASLGEERTSKLLAVYRLTPMHDGEGSALRVKVPVEPLLQRHEASDAAALLGSFSPDRQKLLEARNRREQPLRDDKVLAAWNGLVIRGLVDAARAVQRPDYLQLAASAADFVLQRLRGDDGQLRRSYIAGQAREAGVLEDYAYLADGLLALHRATADPRWLAEARGLADRMIRDFEDRSAGGFFLTSEASAGDLLARPRRMYDGVEPAGAAVALRVLLALSARTGESCYRDAADRTIAAFGGAFERSPAAVGSAVVAVMSAESTPATAKAEASPRPNPGLPRSEDFVRITAHRETGAPLALRVTVDDGWHINANPASLKFLIPTTVEVEGIRQTASIGYPAGTLFEPTFSPEALLTYLGAIEIPIVLQPDDSGRATAVSVRYQACDETRCLPPSTSRVELP